MADTPQLLLISNVVPALHYTGCIQIDCSSFAIESCDNKTLSSLTIRRKGLNVTPSKLYFNIASRLFHFQEVVLVLVAQSLESSVVRTMRFRSFDTGIFHSSDPNEPHIPCIVFSGLYQWSIKREMSSNVYSN